jgi:predicted RNase H-like nuclease (RuvC/YqgF family)
MFRRVSNWWKGTPSDTSSDVSSQESSPSETENSTPDTSNSETSSQSQNSDMENQIEQLRAEARILRSVIDDLEDQVAKRQGGSRKAFENLIMQKEEELVTNLDETIKLAKQLQALEISA